MIESEERAWERGREAGSKKEKMRWIAGRGSAGERELECASIIDNLRHPPPPSIVP